jgi:hypothetical protein
MGKMKTIIRSLREGERPPEGKPRRYRNGAGYIRLRWLVGLREYVECYEHRFVAGLTTEAVHHINGRRSDNREENLQSMSRADHGKHHNPKSYSPEVLIERYRDWKTTIELGREFHLNRATISRALKTAGVKARTSVDYKSLALPIDLVIRLYKRGWGTVVIARLFGVTPSTVNRRLRDNAIRIRRPGRHLVKEVVGHNAAHGTIVYQRRT